MHEMRGVTWTALEEDANFRGRAMIHSSLRVHSVPARASSKNGNESKQGKSGKENRTQNRSARDKKRRFRIEENAQDCQKIIAQCIGCGEGTEEGYISWGNRIMIFRSRHREELFCLLLCCASNVTGRENSTERRVQQWSSSDPVDIKG